MMNKIYFHYWCTPRTFNILSRTIDEIRDSGLWDNVKVITINVMGPAWENHIHHIQIEYPRKVVPTHYRSEKLTEYIGDTSRGGMELDTLELLHNDTLNTPVAHNILYLHGKGCVHPGPHLRYKSREEWRKSIVDKVVYDWKSCVDQLKTNPPVGPNYGGGHYSGNFWWATSDHITKNVSPVEFTEQNKKSQCIHRRSPRGAAEFWLFN